MAERKRRVSKTQRIDTSKNTIGKVFKNEVIYSEPSKDSPFVGAVLAGELVNIIDKSYYAEGWVKIEKNITHVIGFIDSRSII